MDKYLTFKFKKFDIGHQNSAMKIGTDGILLGAWANLIGCRNVLDLGTGSGLIALMCAQRYGDTKFIGLDIDKEASIQAGINFEKSPFSDQLKSVHSSIQDFKNEDQIQFDAIVSNPPFFKDSLKAENIQRNTARHTDNLSMGDLFQFSSNLLHEGGKLIIIYPFDQLPQLNQVALNYNFHIDKQVNISHNSSKHPKRVLLEYLYKVETRKIIIDFNIRNDKGEYSKEYISLTKDYHPFL
ncbi:tRNA1(Val) (adenine(37)-N6)-methyltransferase [Flammeovirga sp. EKP202]|uniref:tRNA1(Val) (adenine(37)-N6)-methyltransferase n=1 Tax=Flammeovirga sp. EKP202 TaxID=2770592 RepID=UPI00165F97E2|nr:methyltransferase [Flammeovirga sp. EKP202]MBD0400493.1 methyltransferase [Flammeovirga sp. EKP202]